MRKWILVNCCKWLVMMCHISEFGNLKCYGWCFPLGLVLSVCVPLTASQWQSSPASFILPNYNLGDNLQILKIMSLQHCLPLPTSQAWPFCGITFKLSHARKPENTAMLVFISELRSHFPLITKHSTDPHELRQHVDTKFCKVFGAYHFSFLYYRKGNDM